MATRSCEQRDRRRVGGVAVRREREDLVRPPPRPGRSEQRPRRRIVRRPDDRDLVDRLRGQRRGGQPLGEPRRVADQVRPDRAERPFRGLAIARLPGPRRQPKEDRRGHRPTRRDGVVLRVLGPGDEPLVVVGRVEEPAGRIGEPIQDPVGQPPGEDEPALVEGRLVQGQQPVGEMAVVLEHALPDRPAVLPRPPERAVLGEQAGGDRLRGAHGGLGVARLVEESAGLGQRRDGQPVPGGQGLVVARGLGPGRAAGEQPRPSARRGPPPRAHPPRGVTRDRIDTPSQLPSSVTP